MYRGLHVPSPSRRVGGLATHFHLHHNRPPHLFHLQPLPYLHGPTLAVSYEDILHRIPIPYQVSVSSVATSPVAYQEIPAKPNGP